MRLGAVVAHPRRRASPRAVPRPRRSRWPLPRIRRLRLMPPSPFLTAFLLRAAASTGPTTPAVAAPLPSRLLHLHRSVPPSRPSIRPRLASSSRFVYTCCLLDLMCCARLPSFSTPSPRCRTARAGRMHKDEAGAGLRRWGASRGAEQTAENASRPGVKVR